MCCLSITWNVNPEKFPGKCENYDQQYLWSKCRLSYHTCKQACMWCYISTCKTRERESNDQQIMNVCRGNHLSQKKG